MELHADLRVGRYRLVRQLGRGGMGVVWSAHDDRLDRPVAIKFIAPDHAMDPAFREDFEREARAVSRLDHPNILTVLDFGDHDDWIYMVSPLIGGGTLAARLKRGPWSVSDALAVIEPLASALDYAHSERIVHRDVKPQNVLFTDRGRLVLSDFGLARVMQHSTHLVQTQAGIGTPLYISPEQANSARIGPASDLYSLGVTAYQLLTGRPPFMAETPVALAMAHVYTPAPSPISFNPELSEGVEAALLRMLAKDPAARFPSGQAFAEALADAALRSAAETRATQIAPPRPAPPSPPTRPADAPGATPEPPGAARPASNDGPSPLLAYGSAVAVAIVVLLAVVVWMRGPDMVPGLLAAPTATVPLAAAPSSAVTVEPARQSTATSPAGPNAAASTPAATATQATAPAPKPTVVIASVAASPTALAAASPTVVVAAASPTTVPTLPPAVALEREADVLFADDLRGAVAKYREASTLDLSNGALRRKLGIALWSLDVNREWLPVLEEAVKLDPNDALAWAYLASCYVVDYRYEKVAEAADQARRLAPDSGDTQAAVALKHLVRSEFGSAREAADRARTASPESILALHVYLDVSVVTIDDSNYDEVLSVVQQAMALRPRWGSVRSWLGSVEVNRGEIDSGRQAFEAAKAMEPELRGVDTVLDLLRLGELPTDATEAALKRDLELDPRDTLAMVTLANLDMAQRNQVGAEAGFRRALEIDSRSVGAYVGLGWLALNVRRDLVQAEAMFRKALEIAPNASAADVGMGRVQGERGQWDAALASFQAAIRAWPSEAYGYAWAGRSLIRLGRHAEARPYLEKAQALIPNEPQVQEDLAELRRRGV